MRNKRTPKELLPYVLASLLAFATCEAMLTASFLAAKLLERSLLALF